MSDVRRATIATLWVLLALGSGMLLVATSVPGTRIGLALLGAAVLAGAGVLWLGVAAFAIRDRVQKTPRLRSVSVTVVTAPIAALAVIGSSALGVPTRVRFEVSRPCLDRWVEAHAATHLPRSEVQDPSAPSTVCGYRVLSARQQGEAMLLTLDGTGFIDDVGLAYLPRGPFRALENGGFETPSYERLGGGWYAWSASW